jgi:hypothetical protein
MVLTGKTGRGTRANALWRKGLTTVCGLLDAMLPDDTESGLYRVGFQSEHPGQLRIPSSGVPDPWVGSGQPNVA